LKNRTTWVALALAALCAWHLALRRHGSALPMMVDEGEYACAAKAWADGGLPYRDSYSQKPPMIFAIYRLAYALFPEDVLAPRLLAMLASLATMLLLWRLTPEGWDPAARLAAPAVFGVLSTTPIGSFGFPANTEVFLCAFAALSAWALERRRRTQASCWLAFSGAAAGAAFMTKQTALWTVLAFGVLAAWREGRAGWKRALGLFAAGAAAIPVFWLAYFACQGVLNAFLDDAFRRNMAYSGIMTTTGAAWDQALWLLKTVAPLFLAGDWPVYAAALLALARTSPNPDSPQTLAMLWLAGAILGAVTGLFLFPYYFLQALPPLALAAAAGTQEAATLRPRGRPAIWLLAVFCLFPAAVRARGYFLDPPQVLARRLLFPNPLFESVEIANYVHDHSRPDETFYIFGSEAQIYMYAGRRPATEHVLSYPLTLFPGSRADIDGELGRLAAARPRFILYSSQPASTLIASPLGAEFRDRLRDLIARQYHWVGQVRIGPAGTVYRLGADQVGSGSPDWSDEYSLFLFARR